LAQRRYAAAAWSAVAFLGTIVLMLAIIPTETRRYFTTLIFDPARTGPVFSAINQSWRGALSRLAGSDVPAVWAVVALLTLALGVGAIRAATRAGDRAAALVAAQMIGLLISPISWSHHWIWVVPVVVWALLGPAAGDRRVQWLAGAWLVAGYSYLVPVLVALQAEVPVNSRPGWQTALGLAYPLLGTATLLVVLATSRRPARMASPAGDRP
jgi:alpha-1,2-mannosyltransferase